MLRRLLTENIEVKLVALAMAVALWFYAINEHSEDYECNVPVKMDVPDGVTVFRMVPDTVTAVFTGPERGVRELRENQADKKLAVNFAASPREEAGSDEWTRSFVIDSTKNFTGVPSSLRLKQKPKPNRVDVTFVRLTTKDIPVKFNVVGDPPPGYEIVEGSMGIFPGVVSVRGMKRILERAEYVRTLPFDVSEWPTLGEKEIWIERRIGIEPKVEVKTNGKMKEYPITCDQSVQFWIKLVEAQGERVLKRVPVNILHPLNYPYKVKLVEDTVDVALVGPKLRLDELKPTEVIAHVDVGELRPSKLPHSRPVGITLPPALQGKVRLKRDITVNVDVEAVSEEKPPSTQPKKPE